MADEKQNAQQTSGYITDWEHDSEKLRKKHDLSSKRQNRLFTKKGIAELNIARAYTKNILEDDEQLILIIFGKPGTGKSSLTLWIEYFLEGQWNFDTTCFTHDAWAEHSTSGQGKIIKYEEGRQTFVKRRAMGNNNKDGLDILSIFRALNHVHIINFQNIQDVEDPLLYYHADGVLWTHKVLGEKGYLSGYSPKTLKKDKVQKEIEENTLEPGQYSDFTVRFPDFKETHPGTWAKYDKKKKENLEEVRQRYISKGDDE